MTTNLAFRADAPGVPKARWIASLSSGETVFDNVISGDIAAWRRLRKYLQENNLQITMLRYQTADGKIIKLPSTKEQNIQGYWHAKRQTVGTHIVNRTDVGIGYIKDGILHIYWVLPKGSVEVMTRPYQNKDIGGILNE